MPVCLKRRSISWQLIRYLSPHKTSRFTHRVFLCLNEDFQIRLHYPQTHLSIVPSEFVLPERSSKVSNACYVQYTLGQDVSKKAH